MLGKELGRPQPSVCWDGLCLKLMAIKERELWYDSTAHFFFFTNCLTFSLHTQGWVNFADQNLLLSIEPSIGRAKIKATESGGRCSCSPERAHFVSEHQHPQHTTIILSTVPNLLSRGYSFSAFGVRVINIKPILKTLPQMFAHADKGVREEVCYQYSPRCYLKFLKFLMPAVNNTASG